MKRREKLTEEQWSRVFKIRCRSKRGEQVSHEDLQLTTAAYKENKERYAAMEEDIFNATVPFGSNVRWRP